MRPYFAASSGGTSGVGLAIANTNGSGRILASAEAGMTPGPESPMNRSAPSMTSSGGPSRRSGFVRSAYQRLSGFMVPSR